MPGNAAQRARYSVAVQARQRALGQRTATVAVWQPPLAAVAAEACVDALTRSSLVACARVVGFSHRRRARVYVGAMLVVWFAFAATGVAHAGAFFAPITDEFTSLTTGWMTNSLNLGNAIFLTMAFMFCCYQAVAHYVDNNGSLSGVASPMVRTALSLILPFSVMQAARGVLTPACGAANGLVCLAQQIGGIVIGSPAVLTPEALFAKFVQLGWSFPTAAAAKIVEAKLTMFSGQPLLVAAVLLIFSALMAFAIIIAGFFIAVELVLATLRATFSVPLHAWQLGFMGSQATASLGTPFWTACLKTIAGYIAVIAMVSASSRLADQWNAAVSQTSFNSLGANLNMGILLQALKFLCGTLGLLVLTKVLPADVRSAISGQVNVNPQVWSNARAAGAAAGQVGSAARAVAAPAASAAGRGATAAGGLARGGWAAAGAAAATAWSNWNKGKTP